MMTKFKITFGLFILLFIIVWGASPYWTLYQINQAIEQNQTEKISKYIDFPAVKSNLKSQIHEKLNQNNDSETNTLFFKYRQKLTIKISEQIVDIVVTPDSVALLMKGKRLNQNIKNMQSNQINYLQSFFDTQKSNNRQDAEQKLIQSTDSSFEKTSDIQAHYLSINTFELIVPLEYLGQTQFIFKRNGFQWKLIKIYSNELKV